MTDKQEDVEALFNAVKECASPCYNPFSAECIDWNNDKLRTVLHTAITSACSAAKRGAYEEAAQIADAHSSYVTAERIRASKSRIER